MGENASWRETGWLFIVQTQKLVDMPTWLGAHHKALGEGATDAQAVANADQAVATRTAPLVSITRSGSSATAQ